MPYEVLPRLACCGVRSAIQATPDWEVASRRKLLPLNRLRTHSMPLFAGPLQNSSLFRPRSVAFRHDQLPHARVAVATPLMQAVCQRGECPSFGGGLVSVAGGWGAECA